MMAKLEQTGWTCLCRACDPPVFVDLDERAKHDTAHHKKAKRRKPKERHQWRTKP